VCVLLRNMHAVALAQVDTAPQSDLFISFSRYVLMRNMHAVALALCCSADFSSFSLPVCTCLKPRYIYWHHPDYICT
jgi:hypothetical protein